MTLGLNIISQLSFGNRGGVMGIPEFTAFFMWCTILNGCLLIFWTLACISFPDLVYRTQSKWFPMPRETFTLMMYAFLGLFKIVFLVFNLIPFVALLIAG
jgi:hypothetical protein